MSLIVKTVTRLTLGFILLYGVYLTLNGHVSPGGGFAGGVIVALSIVHIMLAFGKEVTLKRLHSRMLRLLISVSALVFLYIVMISLGGPAGTMRRIFTSEIVIPLSEMAVVGFGLFAMFIALVLLSKLEKNSE